jgi:hypothetical protein
VLKCIQMIQTFCSALAAQKPAGPNGCRPEDLFPPDGRISDLTQAILEHQSVRIRSNTVIDNFTALSNDPGGPANFGTSSFQTIPSQLPGISWIKQPAAGAPSWRFDRIG